MNEEARLTVTVQPNAGRNEIKGFYGGILYLKIAAPPVGGKAKRELINYLSKILGIPKSRISVEKALRAKKKTIGIDGLNQEQLEGIINSIIES